jgi:type II secretory pathway component PulF
MMLMAIAMTTKFPIQRLLALQLPARVRSKELLLFYTQMTILIESGTSVPSGLDALAKQMPMSYFKQVVIHLTQLVREGQMLSEAMGRYPKVFSPIYVGMIRAGESGGFLPKIFQRIVTLQEQKQELHGILSAAFAYPAVLMGVAGLVVIFMLTAILPRFIDVYQEAGVSLPIITRLLLVVYAAVANYWFICLPLLAGVIWLALRYLRSPHGKQLLDNLLIDVPLLGTLFRLVYLEQLLRTLGILLDSGVPMYDAIILTRNTLGNHRYVQLMSAVLNSVSQGQGLAESFQHSDLIPPTVRQMIQTGEAAGALGSVLSRVAEFYYERVREHIRMLTRLIEPVMTLVMGGIIGIVALALVLPILQLARTLHTS